MSGVKGRSGRKPKTELTRQTEQTLIEASPDAMKYLRDVGRGLIPDRIKTYVRKDGMVVKVPCSGVDPIRVEVCKYIIDQDIGRPTQRTELAGELEQTINILSHIPGLGDDATEQKTESGVQPSVPREE